MHAVTLQYTKLKLFENFQILGVVIKKLHNILMIEKDVKNEMICITLSFRTYEDVKFEFV